MDAVQLHQRAGRASRRAARGAGFTLIEVLVSLLILSVLAATAWKGVDAMSSARQVADGNLKQTLRLQSVMTQLEADLAQVMDTLVVPGFQFDGASMRMTRRSGPGVQVVVWTVRQGRWQRWASPVTARVGELQDFWTRSMQLQGLEPGTLTALEGVLQWQVYCFRSGAMTNCQSTGNVGASRAQQAAAAGSAEAAAAAAAAAMASREQLPSAVRCRLTLGEGSGASGAVSRDLLLAPQPNQN